MLLPTLLLPGESSRRLNGGAFLLVSLISYLSTAGREGRGNVSQRRFGFQSLCPPR